MRKLIYVTILTVGLTVINVMPLHAQLGEDAARALMIDNFSKRAQKAIKAEIEAQSLMATGHIFIKEEVETTTNFQREFNEYLDDFHDILSFAAEVYGIYYEVTQISKNISELNDIVSEYTTNTLAVAFHTRRNIVYRNIIINGIDIVADIKVLCTEKMTEKEKQQLLTGIRPKLRKMNIQLSTLCRAIRYTSFVDVWNEITDRARAYDGLNRKAIIERSMRHWKNNAKVK